jgi:hypothetical protein
VLAIALGSGLVTLILILNGLRVAFVRHDKIGVRAIVLTAILSLVTGALTLWQLFLQIQQLTRS